MACHRMDERLIGPALEGMTAEEARALFEYFRQVDESSAGASAAGGDGDGS